MIEPPQHKHTSENIVARPPYSKYFLKCYEFAPHFICIHKIIIYIRIAYITYRRMNVLIIVSQIADMAVQRQRGVVKPSKLRLDVLQEKYSTQVHPCKGAVVSLRVGLCSYIWLIHIKGIDYNTQISWMMQKGISYIKFCF